MKLTLRCCYLLFFIVGSLSNGCQQVTLVVKDIPDNTPPGATIFVTGNFNYWDPGDQYYALKMNPDSTYTLKLPKGSGKVEYKFTRGDWTTVEQDGCGHEMANRVVDYRNTNVVYAEIQSWEDLGPTHCDKVVFVLKKLPKGTPPDADIYITGSFNNWNPGDPRYLLERKSSGSYSIALPRSTQEIEYKFTRGSWGKEEVDEAWNKIPNRQFLYGNHDTVFIKIAGWNDILPARVDSVTFVVKAPKSTLPNDLIYMTGTFNNWFPRDDRYILKKKADGYYTITLPRREGEDYIEYKFTRGGWDTGESDSNGIDSPNRSFRFGTKDTVYERIDGWVDRDKDFLNYHSKPQGKCPIDEQS